MFSNKQRGNNHHEAIDQLIRPKETVYFYRVRTRQKMPSGGDNRIRDSGWQIEVFRFRDLLPKLVTFRIKSEEPDLRLCCGVLVLQKALQCNDLSLIGKSANDWRSWKRCFLCMVLVPSTDRDEDPCNTSIHVFKRSNIKERTSITEPVEHLILRQSLRELLRNQIISFESTLRIALWL